MIYSYCKRCKTESPGEVCRQCGKRASAGAQRDIWSISTAPLLDGRIWLSTFLVLLCVAALLLLIVFGLEFIMHGSERTAQLWQGSVFRLILALVPLGMGVMFLVLLLQGKEANVYYLDRDGAHQQTWHRPSFIRSWARLQSADPGKNVPQQDGTVMHLSQERHIRWEDVQAVRYVPQRAAIRLYHTPHCAPMILRMPGNEYELAAAYVGKYCKGK